MKKENAMINSTLESGMFPFFGMPMQSEQNRCPLCGIALNEKGVCPKCGYQKQ